MFSHPIIDPIQIQSKLWWKSFKSQSVSHVPPNKFRPNSTTTGKSSIFPEQYSDSWKLLSSRRFILWSVNTGFLDFVFLQDWFVFSLQKKKKIHQNNSFHVYVIIFDQKCQNKSHSDLNAQCSAVKKSQTSWIIELCSAAELTWLLIVFS